MTIIIYFYNYHNLLLKVFLLLRKKIATQGRTQTFCILISLPYHSDYTTTPTRQNTGELSTYTSKLSFLTVTSITGDPSPFHNI